VSPPPKGQLQINLLWICSRTANIILGVLLAFAGLRLWVSGGSDWCSFQGTPRTVTTIIGGGLMAGGLLLFAARSAGVGLPLVAIWLLFWTWTPRVSWGNASCWQSAIVLAALSLNMALMGFSNRERRSQPDTRTMLFFAAGYLVAAAVLWFKGR